MKKKKYTYVPNKSIENVITTNASFTGDELLDGVYLRGRKNFADGGVIPKKILENAKKTALKDGYDQYIVYDENGFGFGRKFKDWEDIDGLVAKVTTYYSNGIKKVRVEQVKNKMADGGMMAKGGQLEVGDMVMVDDGGYVKLFSGFDTSQPAKIISKDKKKVFGKVRYFYGLEMADGKKPFNNAEESMLTKVSKQGGYMADGGMMSEKQEIYFSVKPAFVKELEQKAKNESVELEFIEKNEDGKEVYRAELTDAQIKDFKKLPIQYNLNYAKGGRTKSKYTYVPNRNIENVITTNSSFSGDELLDGVYIKGRKKFKDGGRVVKKMGDRAVAEKIMEMDAKAWEDLDIKSGSQLRADKDLQRKYLDRMFEADKVLARAKNPKRVMDILEDENYHSAWGTLYTKGKSPYPVFAEGGEMRKLRHRSLNRRAEELVGDEAWDSLSTEDQTELAAELVAEGVLAVPVLEDGGMMAGDLPTREERSGVEEEKIWKIIYQDCLTCPPKSTLVEGYSAILEANDWRNQNPKKEFIQIQLYGNKGDDIKGSLVMADGAEVADAKYVITYELDGKKKEKLFDDKDKAESFMELMGSEDDVTNMKLTEKKPAKAKKAEPAAAPVNLFAKPAIGQAKPAKKPSDRQDVPVKGIGPAIARYDALKEIIKNAEAEKELLDGQIKEVGRDKFLEMYKDEGFRPKNFNIVDGGEKILYVTSDTYQGSRYGLSPEKISLLEQYDDILESETTYTINAKVLNKPGVAEAISKMIMSSKILTDEDKAELIQAETKTVVRKGTIDRLLQYPDPAVIFDLIDPTVSLR